ncbi:MAG: hypothetical protein ICV86_14955 [Microcoleus sp. T3-bin5]|nr:hypothetical protein [Microcoleus sp. T3-bin5]
MRFEVCSSIRALQPTASRARMLLQKQVYKLSRPGNITYVLLSHAVIV